MIDNGSTQKEEHTSLRVSKKRKRKGAVSGHLCFLTDRSEKNNG